MFELDIDNYYYTMRQNLEIKKTNTAGGGRDWQNWVRFAIHKRFY